jgi:hypothetical protein
MIDLRLPNITGTTDREQLTQMKSYMHQLVEQLNWALNTIETKPTSSAIVYSSKNSLLKDEKPVVDAPATFNAIKGLIIKSADIISAYYEEIERKLSGIYVAESDFGTYMQETELNINGDSTSIKQIFDNIQTLTNTSIPNIEKYIIETKATIKTGYLYTEVKDGVDIPIYGIEIGQTNTDNGEEVFNKFARFTSDRLSFYDANGSEIAYISDYKFYMIDAEIKGTLKIGGYLVNTTSGLTFKWVGRE